MGFVYISIGERVIITPNPSTFSIWSIIYGLLILSSIVMIIKSGDEYYKEVINKITSLFRLSSLFNILWIVSFSYLQLEISVLFIFGFLFSLSLILEKILSIETKGHFLIPLTFGMYTGWLFIATVVNISATLVKLNWDLAGNRDESKCIDIDPYVLYELQGIENRIC